MRQENLPADKPVAIDFAPFHLDFRGGQLLRGSEPIALRPKTWSVLRYLAERPGMLVTKNDLLDAVWTDLAVTESVLSKSIGEVRSALGDSFKAPRFIETVHRRGFRFIAPTGRQGAAASDQLSVADDQWLSPASAPITNHRSLTTDHFRQVTAFVGRANELQRLGALFAQACAGERQMVFITGPAGIGKTALVGAFLDVPAVRESAGEIWIARGVCVEQRGPREAYMPVLEALERLTRRPDADRLAALLRRVAPTWLAQMPWLIGDD